MTGIAKIERRKSLLWINNLNVVSAWINSLWYFI